MSGIVSGINYSLLFGGSSSASDIAASMLTTLYSGATASSGTDPPINSTIPTGIFLSSITKRNGTKRLKG